MLEVVDTGINSFASVASHVDVPPSEEPVFIITSGQLEAIILQVTMPLLERLENLERKVGSGEGGEGAPDSHKRQDNLHQVVQNLRAENMALNTKLEALQEIMPWVEALSRKLARLEGRIELHRDNSPKAEEHIEELYQIMRKNKLPSLSFANAAKFLGISKGRIKQLKPQIAKDGRFDILHSTGHRQRLIITLRRHGAKTG